MYQQPPDWKDEVMSSVFGLLFFWLWLVLLGAWTVVRWLVRLMLLARGESN